MKKYLALLAIPAALLFSCGTAADPGSPDTPDVPVQKTIKADERADKGGSGVMLQGFTWTSPTEDGDWYKTMSANAPDIKDTFEYVWFPPCTDSADANGYLPRQLNKLEQAYTKNGTHSPTDDYERFYGTEVELKKVIDDIKPCKAIADIVINHRCGLTEWGDFQNPDWGCVKGKRYPAICKDDEGFTSPDAEFMNGCRYRGADDTGENYSAGRDIDHTSAEVQDGIIEWLNNVMKKAGFVGWRYDMTKGYAGIYNGYYNAMTKPEFSVGEYWDGNAATLKKWLDATTGINRNVAGVPGRTFDFACHYTLVGVFGNENDRGEKGESLENKNFGLLGAGKNLFEQYPGYAVSFVDNHDTGSTQKDSPVDQTDMGAVYAYILTHPGYPCVAWFHYFAAEDCPSETSKAQYLGGTTVKGTTFTLKSHIQKLIKLRKDAGITDLSKREVLSATDTCYAAKITGENKDLIVSIGETWEAPTGYSVYTEGTDFTVYVQD